MVLTNCYLSVVHNGINVLLFVWSIMVLTNCYLYVVHNGINVLFFVCGPL